MTYLIIDADGELHTQPATPTIDAINEAVGPEGWAFVPITYSRLMRAFVNDCGLVLPDTYRRNPVGAGVLATLGASQQPYAGPVVITGWGKHSWTEIVGLDGFLVQVVTRLHTAVTAAIGDPAAVTEFGAEWGEQIRAYAEHVRTAETPAMQFIPLGGV